MTASMTDQDFQALDRFASLAGEPAFVTQLRQQALELAAQLAGPDIPKVNVSDWPLESHWLPGAPPQLAELKPGTQAYIEQVGLTTPTLTLPPALIDQGVILCDWWTALRDYPDLVESYYFQQAAKLDDHYLTAYHAAYLNQGIFLYVPAGVVIDQPIESAVRFETTAVPSFNHHVLIVAETGSQFAYVERYQSEGNQSATANIVTEIVAHAEAQVKYAAIDELGPSVSGFLTRRAYCYRQAQVNWAVGMLNEGDVIADYNANLQGEGSQSQVNVVGISAGDQFQAVNTRVSNYGRHSVGHIYQKGVILNQARLTFNGIGHIYRGAVGADAQQEERILMFSDLARGDVNPILLIDEHDVTAGHAASMGRVDQEELYYLMSRGISGSEARRLVIRGFLGSVIVAIPLTSMREALVDLIDQRLQVMDRVE